MPRSPSSSGEAASIDSLATQFREIVSRPKFDRDRWKSLKVRIAATRASDRAGVIEKLRIVLTPRPGDEAPRVRVRVVSLGPIRYERSADSQGEASVSVAGLGAGEFSVTVTPRELAVGRARREFRVRLGEGETVLVY